MKKLLTIILMLAMILSLAGCASLPEDFNGAIENIKGGITDVIDKIVNGSHEHTFKIIESTPVSCTKDGFEKRVCTSCGEMQEEVFTAPGHDFEKTGGTEPTCDVNGADFVVCNNCGRMDTQTVPMIGHDFGEPSEASRFAPCMREGCDAYAPKFPEGGKYSEDLTFTFGDETKAALEAKYEELCNILENAEKYDENLHGYATSGELADSYAVAEALYDEYSNLIYATQGQYYIAMTLYYCDMDDAELEANYTGIQTYYTELVTNFYSLSSLWYDSMYREFFFYGATEDEIKDFLAESKSYSDSEYAALSDRNSEIENEVLNLSNPLTGGDILVLYAEFVENNNRIAEILGYDTYLDYAYKNLYDREYTYQEVAEFVEYVREYITPLYNMLYEKWDNLGYTQDDVNVYEGLIENSFFTSHLGNDMFNNYIDDKNMAFNANTDNVITFSDHLNNLVSDGNMFRGSYEGAYVTYIPNLNLPIAYFGAGYDGSFTIAHEFGHYMNEVYNKSEYNQSYDLLETHSQGNEMLYLSYIKDNISASAFSLVETYNLLNMLSTIMSAVQVDCFEQAIYLNSYDGPNADVIMADGKISYDEYDLLYSSISEYLGIEVKYRRDQYWRYGMTVTSPCYYISYSISAINALQLYSIAKQEGFDVAKECYLKLVTYTDVNPEMTTEEVLAYAGLVSYTDEQAYVKISSLFEKK